MEDADNYSVEIDRWDIGEFTVKIMKKWGLTYKRVDEAEAEEVFLFYLKRILERNPNIREKLIIEKEQPNGG